MFFFVFLAFLCLSETINVTVGDKVVLCERDVKVCTCRYTHDHGVDFLLLNVDCSFTNKDVLEANYSLPSTVHSLDLSSSKLENIPEVNMFQSRTMDSLLLKKNNIIAIESKAFNLPNLKHLDISENYLEYIDPEIFRLMKNLKYLNLASNKFTVLPSMVFHHLNNLQEIVLDGNNIGNFLGEINLFQRSGLALNDGVRHISIRNVGLNAIPNYYLDDAFHLRHLIISNNNFTTLPELPFTLEVLDASDNPINNIYFEDFSNLRGLKELYLNNIEINEVPGFVFEPLKSLKVLELARNMKLTRFSVLAFGQDVLDDADYFALEELSLQDSGLMTLSQDLEIPLGQLRTLNLHGNRWKCDCKILWLKKLQIAKQDKAQLRCYWPLSLHSKRMFELNDSCFTCKTDKRNVLASVAVLAFCVILTTVAIWFFVFIPRYQTRGHAIEEIIYSNTSYLPVPIYHGQR